MMSMTLTDQVRMAIANCGSTQAEIARETGITKGALSRFMSGQRDMTLRTLETIAQVIGVRLVVGRPRRRKKGG